MVPSSPNDPSHIGPENSAASHSGSGVDPELLRMLADAEATVERLKDEIDRRQGHHNLQPDDAIKLADYLQQAQVNWQQVRNFFDSALTEYRSGADWETGTDAS